MSARKPGHPASTWTSSNPEITSREESEIPKFLAIQVAFFLQALLTTVPRKKEITHAEISSTRSCDAAVAREKEEEPVAMATDVPLSSRRHIQLEVQ
ncbi:hypothetical protein CEXT_401411 [Caerostris extrusa]|uniref:Uncharacterized protein n=1 Tax=Caerostris extrusa TaxID=172846 RepID=A0AAV4PSN6_CAEEX|nr:hypothetical protein CEXT_401411 [Caerostris extrusa]